MLSGEGGRARVVWRRCFACFPIDSDIEGCELLCFF